MKACVHAEQFGASIEVGSAVLVSEEERFGVVATGLSAGGGGPLVAALTVQLLAAALRRRPADLVVGMGDAFEAVDRALGRLAAGGGVEDLAVVEALEAQGFSVPGRTATSAVLQGPLAASAAMVGWGPAGVVTARVGDASVWRGRDGQWARVGHPDTLGRAWGAAVPTGWEDEVTRVLGPGVGERGDTAIAAARAGDGWAVTTGAGEHARKTMRRGIGARVRVELGERD